MPKWDTTNGWVIFEDGSKKKWLDSISLPELPGIAAKVWPGRFLKENLVGTLRKAYHVWNVTNDNGNKWHSCFVAMAVLNTGFRWYFKHSNLLPTRQGQRMIFNIEGTGTKFVFHNVAKYPTVNTWTFVEVEEPDTITVTI